LEGWDEVSQTADTPEPKQARLSKEHTGHSTLSPQLAGGCNPESKPSGAALCFEALDKLLPGDICSRR